MSDETDAYGVTFKGQGQTDPWITVRASTIEDFKARLNELDRGTLELAAGVAAEHVSALNAQPGISIQRDRPAPPAGIPMPMPSGGNASGGAAPSSAGTSGAATPRPGLSTSLSVEDDGNYWITLPYQRNRELGDKQRDHAKALNARYKPDDAPASVPRTAKGAPERPWCVHTRYCSEEQVAELLRLHETGFSEIK